MTTTNDYSIPGSIQVTGYENCLKKVGPGLFRKYLLEKLPVYKFARYFNEVMGCPGKQLYTAMGSLILQQLHDLSDPDVMRALTFNLDWHYALDITDDSDAGK